MESQKTDDGAINGVFADSLAALSTRLELAGDDESGMRRAKSLARMPQGLPRPDPAQLADRL